MEKISDLKKMTEEKYYEKYDKLFVIVIILLCPLVFYGGKPSLDDYMKSIVMFTFFLLLNWRYKYRAFAISLLLLSLTVSMLITSYF